MGKHGSKRVNVQRRMADNWGRARTQQLRRLGLIFNNQPGQVGPHDPVEARRRRDPHYDRACYTLPGGSKAEVEALAAKYRSEADSAGA